MSLPLFSIAIIGAGPSGLIAAESLSRCGYAVTVYDRMPTPGRKFLMAGHGGLNLTNSEPLESFCLRYGTAATQLRPALHAFSPEHLVVWCEELGEPTFVGTSGRVFPKAMKASGLMRAWRARLETQGVIFALRHTWQGWTENNELLFTTPEGHKRTMRPDAVLLALGGASWPHLGSNGAWTSCLSAHGVSLSPFRPANCSFIVSWTPLFANRFAGHPLKPVIVTFGDRSIQGELSITKEGIEGGPIYALSSALRSALDAQGTAEICLDLRPGLSHETLLTAFSRPRGSQSLSTYLRKAAGLSPLAIGLVQEYAHQQNIHPHTPATLTSLIKAYPLKLTATGPLERAISSAGGVSFEAIDARWMLKALPGVFVAGEMIDWEAPTGGYLLQACFSTGIAAANGLAEWLSTRGR